MRTFTFLLTYTVDITYHRLSDFLTRYWHVHLELKQDAVCKPPQDQYCDYCNYQSIVPGKTHVFKCIFTAQLHFRQKQG